MVYHKELALKSVLGYTETTNPEKRTILYKQQGRKGDYLSKHNVPERISDVAHSIEHCVSALMVTTPCVAWLVEGEGSRRFPEASD